MWHISTVPACTASRRLQAGNDLAGGETWIWNLLSVASATALANISAAAVERIERLREARGQPPLRTSGIDWAIAGAATAVRGKPARGLQKFTTLHVFPLSLFCVGRDGQSKIEQRTATYSMPTVSSLRNKPQRNGIPPRSAVQ